MVKMCFRIDKEGKKTRFSIAFFPNDGELHAVLKEKLQWAFL